MEQKLSKAFQEVLEGLQEGQALEELLASYPDFADELRSLVQMSAKIPDARVNRGEIQAMRSRLDKQFESKLAALDFPKKRPYHPILALVASLALVFLGIWIFFPRGESNSATEITLTQSTQAPSETASATREVPSITPSATIASPTASSTAPSPESSAEACSPRSDWPEYRLRSGDTLSQIALNSGTTVEALLLANCLDNPRTLIVGQTIYVPRLWAGADATEVDDDANGDNSGSNSGEGSDPINQGGDDNSGSGSDDGSGHGDNSGSGSSSGNSGSGSNDD